MVGQRLAYELVGALATQTILAVNVTAAIDYALQECLQ